MSCAGRPAGEVTTYSKVVDRHECLAFLFPRSNQLIFYLLWFIDDMWFDDFCIMHTFTVFNRIESFQRTTKDATGFHLATIDNNQIRYMP